MPRETYPVVLSRIEEMTPSVRNFHFEFRDKPRFDFAAGQFVMVERLKEGKTVRKSYSIASPPHFAGKIELCVKLVDDGFMSGWFFTLKEGDETEFIGPLGVFKLQEPLPEHLLFVGTGTGIAPLRAMVLDLLNKGHSGKMTLLLGVRHENEVLFEPEMRELEKRHANFEFIPVISRPQPEWSGEKGYVQGVIERRFAEPQNRQVYLCGLVPMVNDMQKTLERLGYGKEAVHFEKWT